MRRDGHNNATLFIEYMSRTGYKMRINRRLLGNSELIKHAKKMRAVNA